VNVSLRERDGDAGRVEGFLDGLRDAEVDVPVVGRLSPRPGDEVDRGVGQFDHLDRRGRVRRFVPVNGKANLRAWQDREKHGNPALRRHGYLPVK